MAPTSYVPAGVLAGAAGGADGDRGADPAVDVAVRAGGCATVGGDDGVEGDDVSGPEDAGTLPAAGWVNAGVDDENGNRPVWRNNSAAAPAPASTATTAIAATMRLLLGLSPLGVNTADTAGFCKDEGVGTAVDRDWRTDGNGVPQE